VRLTLDHKVGAPPVLDGGRLVDVVTEPDMPREFVATAGARP